MGARRRRAHRELVGLDAPAGADEEWAPTGSRASARASAAHARVRTADEKRAKEFVHRVAAFAVVVAVVVFVFYERTVLFGA